jgi:hypothetical protein
MKKILTFEQFASNRAATTNEDAIKAGEESEVVIDDMITTNGTEISSEELLGIVISSETEEEVKDKMYDKFGQTTFAEADISKVVGYWNAYQAEIKEKEKEEEKKKEGGEGGDTADLMADL